MKIKNLVIVLIALAANSIAFGQDKSMIHPPDTELLAKFDQIDKLKADAHTAYRNGHADNALELLEQADAMERALDGYRGSNMFCRSAIYKKALLLARLNRNEEALAAYKQVFRWSPEKGDLVSGSGWDVRRSALDYALLLSKVGKVEEAKAIYYFTLRNLNSPDGDRQLEPVPFIRVFDPDPEGSYVEYSPQQFEAAALMIKAMHGGDSDHFWGRGIDPAVLVARAKELAPDWFYPYVYLAALGYAQPWAAESLAQADARANTIERELIERLRVEMAELKAINAEKGAPGVEDTRPMTDGNARRKRMQVLRPNPDLLKSLASG